MTVNSLSDMARSFAQSRQNTGIRTRLATLGNELSTGKVADLTKRLGGDTVAVRDIDRQLKLATIHTRAITEAGQWTQSIQSYLGRIDTEREALSSSLLALDIEPNAERRDLASAAGKTAFETTVSALNGRFAGQSLFAGRDTDATPLADASDMLAALRIAATGATTAAELAVAIDTWFNAPGGGFETAGYLGDTGGQQSRRIAEDLSISPGIRADDPALRDMMKAAAVAALAQDTALSLSAKEQTAALGIARDRTIAASAPIIGLRADLGQQESLIERRMADVSARTGALSILRNETDSADPFDTAGALQEVQLLLETHYAVTARLSRLNLTDYLR